MMLTPAMQGVILAIAKARQTFDKEGPEAGLIKVCSQNVCQTTLYLYCYIKLCSSCNRPLALVMILSPNEFGYAASNRGATDFSA